MKTCPRCKKTKSLNDFHNCKSKKSGKMSHCKTCRNTYNKNKANEIGHDVIYKRNLEKDPEKYKRKAREYYQKNKKDIIKRTAKWRKENPGCRDKEYQKSREEKIAYAKEWAEKNPEKRAEITRRYSRKFNSDPANRPYIICRKLIARVIALKDGGKKGRTEDMLGYTRYDLKRHIESMFEEGMKWSNHGEWHIDHIKPVSAFISEGETDPRVINALANLQPLWAKDNLSKGAKYDSE